MRKGQDRRDRQDLEIHANGKGTRLLTVAAGKPPDKEEKPRDVVGSIVHGLSVIKSFDADHPQMTLSQVAERVGMTRAGARRYLLTLAHLGYVQQEDRLFRLSPKVMELGYAYLSSVSLPAIAQPFLESLREETGETIALAVLDDCDVVHIARANSNKLLAPTLTIGRRFPAIYTSTGRVLAAMKSDGEIEQLIRKSSVSPPTHLSLTGERELCETLKTVRRNGYAVVDQETEVGVRTLAVPIFGRSGEAVAAINILTNIAIVKKQFLIRTCLPLLKAAANDIQHSLVD